MKQLSRPTRRTTLFVHVVVSVGWLGLTLCLLALGITGATSGSPATSEAAYRSMKVFGDWLLAPLALLALLTGLVLSLGTPWGLARYRWVWTKFWLTLAAALASLLALRSHINTAAAEAAAGQPVSNPVDLVLPPSVALATYLFITALSVLKPWGLTRRGQRQRAASRTRVTTQTATTAAPRQPTRG